MHDRRAGERLGEEEHVRVGPLDLPDQPVPEVQRLGVRVVDPEDLHALVDPVPHHPQNLGPQARPGRCRSSAGRCPRSVFGGFSAYAMLPSARVVNHSGCALTHGWSGAHCSARSIATSSPLAWAAARKARKSAGVPRSGWIASWPPSAAPIAQGEPTSSGPASRRVVAALAVDPADRVDRRQVEHVEAHRRHLRQPLRGGGEGAGDGRVLLGRRHRTLGAGEELVPGGEEGPRPVNPDGVGVADRHQPAQRMCPEQLRQLQGRADPRGERQLRLGQRRRGGGEPRPLRRRHDRARLGQQLRTLGEVVGEFPDALPGGELLGHRVRARSGTGRRTPRRRSSSRRQRRV